MAEHTYKRFGLEGKCVLITGGSKGVFVAVTLARTELNATGIGKAAVKEFAEAGARVYTCSRDHAELEAALEPLKTQSLPVAGCCADVTDAEAAESLVTQALAFFDGKLDVLVNNVGTNRRRQAEDATAEDFDFLMATNVRSALHLCQLCRPHLDKSNAPSIIFDSSVAGGPLALWSGCLYGMTKAALNQLTKNLACEWGKDGIRVNAVAPWFAATPLVQQALDDDHFRRGVVGRTPLNRVAQPEETSGVMVFLASAAASFITGQVIPVDGGFSVNGLHVDAAYQPC